MNRRDIIKLVILALVLVLTRKGGVIQGRAARILYAAVNVYVNVIRSVPFVILLVTIMPLTRLIMGTTIGSTAALVPLVLYISPYLARLLENSLAAAALVWLCALPLRKRGLYLKL